MAIDKSLRRKGRLVRSRNVMTREERIDQMKREETWIAGRSPLGLPKTRVVKIVTKKKKKAKDEKAEEGAVAPAAGAVFPELLFHTARGNSSLTRSAVHSNAFRMCSAHRAWASWTRPIRTSMTCSERWREAASPSSAGGFQTSIGSSI